VAAQLDGSTACYGVDVDSTFLSGEVVLRYQAPCIWRCSTQTKQLFSWTAFQYHTNLVNKACCGSGARSEADDVMLTNELPSLHSPRRYTFEAGDPLPGTYPINNGKTVVVFRREAGVARVYSAESHISFNVNDNKFPDAVDSAPTRDVKNYLKRSTQWSAGVDSAGHILAASMGGSNDDKKNFFIQLASINSGPFNIFETDIKDCLRVNRGYSVKYVMLFHYLSSDDIRPSSYSAEATFYIGPASSAGFSNRYPVVNHVGVDGGWRPQGCPNIKLANIGAGDHHMDRLFFN